MLLPLIQLCLGFFLAASSLYRAAILRSKFILELLGTFLGEKTSANITPKTTKTTTTMMMI
jgi:hypothetical protein